MFLGKNINFWENLNPEYVFNRRHTNFVPRYNNFEAILLYDFFSRRMYEKIIAR